MKMVTNRGVSMEAGRAPSSHLGLRVMLYSSAGRKSLRDRVVPLRERHPVVLIPAPTGWIGCGVVLLPLDLQSVLLHIANRVNTAEL